MVLANGYQMQTTFWSDFTIADKLGIAAIEDTYNRAFDEWKDNYIYLTELVIVLNLKIWEWYEKNPEIGKLYDELWRKADEYACENLKGDEIAFFFRTTD